jgi:hypothetical protein
VVALTFDDELFLQAVVLAITSEKYASKAMPLAGTAGDGRIGIIGILDKG